MSLTSFSLKQPVTIYMLTTALLLLSIIALTKMEISLLPDIEFPRFTIITEYKGASPIEIESEITNPIEETISSLQGIKHTKSSSISGFSIITANFSLDRDFSMISFDMRDKLNLLKNILPQDAEKPLIYKYDPATTPVMRLAICPGKIKIKKLREYIENELIYKFQRIKGVARVELKGGYLHNINIDIDLDRLYAFNLSIKDIKIKLEEANHSSPVGYIEKGSFEYLIKTEGEFKNLDHIKNTVIVMSAENKPVFLKDVASISESYQDRQSSSYYNLREVVILEIFKEPAKNSIKVCDKIIQIINKLESQNNLFYIEIISNQADYISKSIKNLILSAILGGLIAFFILFIFMRNPVFPFMIIISIPVSIAGALLCLYIFNISINIMSIGGLALASGMVLDNSIIIINSIFEKYQKNKTITSAAALGGKSVERAIVASTLTTIIVFLPLIFVKGLMGIIFSNLALAVTFSLVISVLVSLMLIPVMLTGKSINKYIKPLTNKKKSYTNKIIIFNYKKILIFFFNKKKIIAFLYISILFISLYVLIFHIKRTFFPKPDSSILSIKLYNESGTILETTEKTSLSVAKYLTQINGINKIIINNGVDKKNIEPDFEKKGSHFSQLLLFIDPKIIDGQKLQKHIEKNIVISRNIKTEINLIEDKLPEIINLDNENLVLDMYHADKSILNKAAASFKFELKDRFDLDSMIDEDFKSENINIIFDREKAAALGITLKEAAGIIKSSIQGDDSISLHLPNKEIPIIIKINKKDIKYKLNKIFIHNYNRIPIPLSLFANISNVKEKINIKHNNNNLVSKILIPASAKRSQINKIVKNVSKSIQKKFPGVVINVSQENLEVNQNLKEIFFALILAVIFIYMLLASQMQSLKTPLLIICSIPLIFSGITLALLISGETLNILSGMGIIILSGTTVNNAILIYEKFKQNLNQGISAKYAVLDSTVSRIRPILASAATTILSMLPLSLKLAQGVELQAPLAITIIGGLLVSTLLSLFFIPLLLYYSH